MGELQAVRGRKSILALHIAVPAVLICVYLWRAAGGLDPAVRFSDDFFYYVIPSMNWADGNGSTFFPGEPTNGYHPLWFLWMALLHVIGGSGAAFFALVDLSLLALLVGFFCCFDRFLRDVSGDRLAAVIGASLSTLFLSTLSMAGVETALAVFSAAALLAFLVRKPVAEMTARDAVLAGLLGAFLVLSRLDSAVLLIMLALIVVPRLDWRRRGMLAVGAIPLAGYVAFNLVTYGYVGTTSMAAKTLRAYWPPNLWFLLHPSAVTGVLVVTAILGTLAAVVALTRRDDRPDIRRICVALAVAPILQLTAQALTSGWGLFPWYFYIFGMAVGVAIALVGARLRADRRGRRVAVAAALLALLLGVRMIVGAFTPDHWQVDIAAIAQRLTAFSADHPGVYAMGDAAGTPAWEMGQPVVHLEGLMMSASFLDRIRAGAPLQAVFRDYGVNYYVNVRSERSDGTCADIAEPNPQQASPRAPHMSMTACANPVLEFQQGPEYLVRVYRIDPQTGGAIG
jgi:hypothetical protein